MSVHPSRQAALISIRPKSSLTIISPVHSRLRRWTDRCYLSTGKCGINVRKDDSRRKAAGLLGAGGTHVRINRGSVTVWGWCQRWWKRLEGMRPGQVEDWLPIQSQKWNLPSWKCTSLSNKHEKSFSEIVRRSYFRSSPRDVTCWFCVSSMSSSHSCRRYLHQHPRERQSNGRSDAEPRSHEFPSPLDTGDLIF